MRVIPRALNRLFLAPVDARPYALLRIAFSVAAAANFLDIWPLRQVFLSDTGLFRRQESFVQSYSFSLFFIFHSPGAVDALCICAGLAILCFAFGFWTRTAGIAVWLWQSSYSSAAYPALSASDSLFRAVCFLLMISPCGATWSIDAWRSQKGKVAYSTLAPVYGLRLVQWQLIVLYLSTVVQKIPDPGWASGDELSYFLLSVYARTPLTLVAHYPKAMVLVTYFGLATELSVPFLICFRETRFLAFVLGWGLHGGVLFASRLWVFSLIAMVPYFAFLDGNDLRWIHSVVQRISIFRPAGLKMSGLPKPPEISPGASSQSKERVHG